jgi:hypothetical protein
MPGKEAKAMRPVQNKMVNGSFIMLPVRLALPCCPSTEMDSISDAGAMCGRLPQWIVAGDRLMSVATHQLPGVLYGRRVQVKVE